MSTVTDENYFKSLARELDSKLNRISSLIGNHPVGKGNYHEYILRDLITKFLPKRYSIKTGFIYFDEDNISPQLDLMVIDEYETPCILAQYENFVVVYPEAVICVIEVKTTLNKKDFIDATTLIRKVKDLCLNKANSPVGGLIFGFTGQPLTPYNLDRWYKVQTTCDKNLYPDAILSLNRGFIQIRKKQDPEWGHYYVNGDDVDLKWKSLSVFLAYILKYCELKAGVNRSAGKTPFDRFSYINGLAWANRYLKYGIGLV